MKISSIIDDLPVGLASYKPTGRSLIKRQKNAQKTDNMTLNSIPPEKI